MDYYNEWDDQCIKIEAIHNSELYGVIVEAGCGSCIVNNLYQVEGATKTLFYSIQPYAKEFQNYNYNLGRAIERSVSKEFIYSVLTQEIEKSFGITKKTNFALVASFQIQSGLENNLTHGWLGLICIDAKGNIKSADLYHLSIPQANHRQGRIEYFNEISKVAINLLYSKVNLLYTFSSQYIDNVFGYNHASLLAEDIKNKSTLLNILKNIGKEEENFLVFTPSGIIRFEDFCRDKEGIILMKGSFNPIHEGHVDCLEHTQKQFPSYNSAFFISISRFDKPDIEIMALLEKIKKINSLGYTLIISKQSLFVSNVEWIRQRWKLPVIFPVGVDTINRWIVDTIATEIDLDNSLPRLGWSDKEHKLIEKELVPWTKDQIMEKSAFKHFRGRDWINVKFLVFARKSFSLHEDAKYFTEHILLENEYDDPLGISSTKIRNGEMESKL